MVKSGDLKTQFEVVHVDSHSDLGLGDPGWAYIATNLLHLPLERRCNPDTSKITSGNFLLFALACEWMCKIDFVYPPGYDFIKDNEHEFGRDIFNYCFKNNDISGKNLTLQLYKLEREDLDTTHWDYTKVEGIPVGPEVPFNLISCDEYENYEPFSFMNLSRSPDYTPPKADPIIEIIKEYIIEI